MPVEFKDYYSVLGVARDASGDDIKKAFRKLARLYHPDVAKDKKTAEQKFKEINEAHEVLSDPAKRKKYDELGADWETGGMAGTGGAPRAGTQARWRTRDGKAEQEYHFGGTGFSDFFEQFFGGARGGVDVDDLFRDAASRSSHSSGRQAAMRGQDVEGDILVTLDEALNGSTRSISLQRIDQSSGEVETETFQVRIPPGAQEGRRIRVAGKGGAGHGGGAAGDLFLRVRLAAHPDFDVRGTDLYHELELAPWEAVLGGHVFVPTLLGRVRLRIPAGTNSGTQLRIKGQGLPKQPGSIGDRGDLYAVVRVNVPVQVTSQEQELWQKLAEVSRFRPREQQSEETNR